MHMAESALSSTQSIIEDKWSQNASVLTSLAFPNTNVAQDHRNSQSQELYSSVKRESEKAQHQFGTQKQDKNP